MLSRSRVAERPHPPQILRVAAFGRGQPHQAAAAKWGVPLSECNAVNGRIVHAGGKSESYGALANAAAQLPVPTGVELKPRSAWHILGKSTARLDTPPKVDGSAQFGLDVRLPDMLVGTIAACPVFGGKLKAVGRQDTMAVRPMAVRRAGFGPPLPVRRAHECRTAC
jgi:isoquinoline 1-oxidoreductase subunit beta